MTFERLCFTVDHLKLNVLKPVLLQFGKPITQEDYLKAVEKLPQSSLHRIVNSPIGTIFKD